MSKPDREVLLDREHSVLSIRRQCQILSLCRSEVYRRRPQPDPNELLLMRRLDELYTAHPFLGSRRLTALLRFEGCQVNRKRVQRLMRHMGIAALGPKPRTTKPAQAIRFTRICCATSPLIGRTKCGLPISHTSQWAVHSSTSLQLSTGRAERYSPGDFQTQWIAPSVSTRLRKHWPGSADRRFSIPTRVASSPGPRSRVCYRRLVLGFRWTVADAGWTTCLLSAVSSGLNWP